MNRGVNKGEKVVNEKGVADWSLERVKWTKQLSHRFPLL